MKAYCYRSGHVMIGRTVPLGAIELADHPDEAELLRVVRWHTSVIEDEEGNPVVVLKDLAIGPSDDIKVTLMDHWRRAIRADLRTIVDGTRTAAFFTANKFETWPESAVELSGRFA